MTDQYDRIYGELHGLPMTRPATVVEALPIAGNVTTWVVQTAQHNDASVVFVQFIADGTAQRLVLPAKVVATIVRQDATLRERLADRRSEERKKRDAERAKRQSAAKVLGLKAVPRRRNGAAS